MKYPGPDLVDQSLTMACGAKHHTHEKGSSGQNWSVKV